MSRLSVLVASLIVLAGCGGSVSVNEKGKVSVGHKTLSTAAVPFTFEYPLGFREATDASVKAINALAVVGPAADSYLAVRRNGTAMTVAGLPTSAGFGKRCGDTSTRVTASISAAFKKYAPCATNSRFSSSLIDESTTTEFGDEQSRPLSNVLPAMMSDAAFLMSADPST